MQTSEAGAEGDGEPCPVFFHLSPLLNGHNNGDINGYYYFK